MKNISFSPIFSVKHQQSAYEMKNTFQSIVFTVDFGATQHFVNDKNLFSELNDNIEYLNITIANKNNLINKDMFL